MYTISCTICGDDALAYQQGNTCCKCHNKRCTRYQNEKYASDPAYRLKKVQRNRIRKAILCQNTTKLCKTMELIGCSTDALKDHLESQFTNDMSWSNYGTF